MSRRIETKLTNSRFLLLKQTSQGGFNLDTVNGLSPFKGTASTANLRINYNGDDITKTGLGDDLTAFQN